MKFQPIFCVGLIAAASATPVAADPFEPGTGSRPFVQDQRPPPEPRRDADRPARQREARAPSDADRGHMRPDERRQLRRDIQDAGKDIYHRDREAPRREQRR